MWGLDSPITNHHHQPVSRTVSIYSSGGLLFYFFLSSFVFFFSLFSITPDDCCVMGLNMVGAPRVVVQYT